MSRKSLAAVLCVVTSILTAILFGLDHRLVAQTAVPSPTPAQQETQAGNQEKTGQDPDQAKAKPKAKSGRDKQAKARRDRPGFYMGRQIAEVMSWEGVDWLFRETRVDEEQPEAMLDALKIPKGATVADVGAGAGYHSIRMARRVGPRGTVLASDLQPEMLKMLQSNARQARVTNIKPIRATQLDTKLPEAAVDLILMVDVYHECSDPEITLQGLLKALKPHGRLVLVEFRGEDDNVPIKPEHKMTLEQVRLEVEPQGFTFKESLEFLPWQHVIIFEKPAEASKGDEPGKNAAGETAKSKPAAPGEPAAKNRSE
jgi:ubiquinone/menaquinone biosynthesis C-methylase UbiE